MKKFKILKINKNILKQKINKKKKLVMNMK